MGITQGMGARVQRVEDERYLTGRTHFIDAMALPRMLTVAFVRGGEAHARLLGIGVQTAAACPGVSHVMTGEEANALCQPIRADRTRLGRTHYAPTDYPVMASGVIRHVGEIVAAVVADDRYLAEDAAEQVRVDVEPLPPVLSVDQALAPDAPLVHGTLGDNRHYHGRLENGEVDAAFESAHRVVRTQLRSNRHCASPMETRAVLAHLDADGRLVVYTSSQMPHMVRTKLADLLGLPERNIRVVAPDVGGGFGLKCHVFPEELILAALALKLERPVKWIEDRRENYMAGFHAKEECIEFALALGEDGTIEAIDAAFHADGGAYTSFPFTPSSEPSMAAATCTGPYRVRNLRTEAIAAYTNKSTLSVCRGVGLPIVNYALEHSIDRAAAELGLDPAEMRRRNLLRSEDFPYGTPNFT
ncbi:MAG: xanthine dehydrogenase family protein molybdopterin-binding subunit, partial [Acidimicrobiia bacterium]|nr:xanthine dehydrogenase family protein molybdopterin-binding subunit [Acidimicrobiia bacterium]